MIPIVRMAEPFGHDLEVDAGGEHERGMPVPQLMEGEPNVSLLHPVGEAA